MSRPELACKALQGARGAAYLAGLRGADDRGALGLLLADSAAGLDGHDWCSLHTKETLSLLQHKAEHACKGLSSGPMLEKISAVQHTWVSLECTVEGVHSMWS